MVRNHIMDRVAMLGISFPERHVTLDRATYSSDQTESLTSNGFKSLFITFEND
jgi:sialic acid synthase SpsE